MTTATPHNAKHLDARLHIFDICGTLFHEDTTVGFFQHYYEAQKRPLFVAILRALRSNRFLNLGIRAAERISGRHLLKQALVWTLRNSHRNQVSEIAKEYANQLLQRKRNPALFDLLYEAIGKGEKVILASASIEPVVEALADHLKLAYVSSTLSTKSGIYTGRFNEDITGRKHECLAQSMANSSHISVYTDNLSDRDLIEHSNEAFIILTAPSYRSRWNIQNAHFIEVWT